MKICYLNVVFPKNDIKRLSEESKKILIEQNEEYLEYVKNEEESFIERIY